MGDAFADRLEVGKGVFGQGTRNAPTHDIEPPVRIGQTPCSLIEFIVIDVG